MLFEIFTALWLIFSRENLRGFVGSTKVSIKLPVYEMMKWVGERERERERWRESGNILTRPDFYAHDEILPVCGERDRGTERKGARSCRTVTEKLTRNFTIVYVWGGSAEKGEGGQGVIFFSLPSPLPTLHFPFVFVCVCVCEEYWSNFLFHSLPDERERERERERKREIDR